MREEGFGALGRCTVYQHTVPDMPVPNPQSATTGRTHHMYHFTGSGPELQRPQGTERSKESNAYLEHQVTGMMKEQGRDIVFGPNYRMKEAA